MHQNLSHISLEISTKMALIIHHENHCHFMLVKMYFRNANCCSGFKYKIGKYKIGKEKRYMAEWM